MFLVKVFENCGFGAARSRRINIIWLDLAIMRLDGKELEEKFGLFIKFFCETGKV